MEQESNYFASTQLIMESLKCTPAASTANRGWGGVQMCSWNGSIDICAYNDVPDDILLVYHLGGTQRIPVWAHRSDRSSISRPGLISILQKNSSARWNVDGEFRSLSLHISADHFRTSSTLGNTDKEIRSEPRLAFSDPFICATLDVLAGEMETSEQNDPLFVHSLVETLVGYIERKFYANPPSQNSEGLDDNALIAICDHIDNTLEFRLSVDDLAQLAGIPCSRFSRKFYHSTGKTPYQYVIARRLRIACNLLKQGNDDLSEIALRCGFSSQAHFSSAFKNSFGMTPATYRRAPGF